MEIEDAVRSPELVFHSNARKQSDYFEIFINALVLIPRTHSFALISCTGEMKTIGSDWTEWLPRKVSV